MATGDISVLNIDKVKALIESNIGEPLGCMRVADMLRYCETINDMLEQGIIQHIIEIDGVNTNDAFGWGSAYWYDVFIVFRHGDEYTLLGDVGTDRFDDRWNIKNVFGESSTMFSDDEKREIVRRKYFDEFRGWNGEYAYIIPVVPRGALEDILRDMTEIPENEDDLKDELEKHLDYAPTHIFYRNINPRRVLAC